MALVQAGKSIVECGAAVADCGAGAVCVGAVGESGVGAAGEMVWRDVYWAAVALADL